MPFVKRRRFPRRRYGTKRPVFARRKAARNPRTKKTWAIAKRAARSVFNARTETKYVFINYQSYTISALTYAVRTNVGLMPARGDGDSQRTGDQINLRRFSLSLEHYYDSANGRIGGIAGTYKIRFLLIQRNVMEDNSAPPWGLGDYFQELIAGAYHMSPYNWDRVKGKGYRILKDWTVGFAPDSRNHNYETHVRLDKELHKLVRFDIASTTTHDNAIWLLTCTDAEINPVNVYVSGRITYQDA